MSRTTVLLGMAALVLATAPALAQPPSVAAPPPPRRDAAPALPSVHERLDEIRARVQAVAAYPASARARGVAGEARLAFRVGDDGRAHDVALLDSSGSALLDRAAARAVQEAAGLPRVMGRVVIPVRFALSD